jgi:hypothetical protein
MPTCPNSWRDSLESVHSRGKLDIGVKRLADLHAARQRHHGQFFTPIALAKLAWEIAQQAFALLDEGKKIRLLDNSAGSGRMFHFATPDRFRLHCIDVDGELMKGLTDAAKAADFTGDFSDAGMQNVVLSGYHVALINPPFSLQLNSPHLARFPCTRTGLYGPSSSAVSDEYALAQALDAAQVVIAVLPASMVDGDRSALGFLGEAAQRLRAVFMLPSSTFKNEGANVQTCLAVFDSLACARFERYEVLELADYQPPFLGLHMAALEGRHVFDVCGIEEGRAVITLPVTGDKSVRIVHSGRKIHLQFSCGFTQGRVLNAVLRKRIQSMEGLRLGDGVKYSGQGALDVEVLLATGNALQALEALCATIESADAVPVVDPGLKRHLGQAQRRAQRALTPLGHWVFKPNTEKVCRAVAKQTVAMVPSDWLSPTVRVGHAVELGEVKGGGWLLSHSGFERRFTNDEVQRVFDMPKLGSEWTEVHPPMQKRFPTVARGFEKRALELGIDKWLNWGYQFQDAIELAMKPKGAVIAWKQGLGKARLAAALILLRGVKHGLVPMPAYLVDEYVKRLESAGLDPALWQIIDSPSKLRALRRINIISYERLRLPLGPGSNWTYAKRLRHRIGIVASDEGEVLANPDSAQSRALAVIAPKAWYIPTGTPMPNYPRDLLPMGKASGGDGTVGQPYGWRRPVLEAKQAISMANAIRGRDAFREKFVTTEWVTNEFADTLTDGAKREIPKVSNLVEYRQWLSCFVKRRLPGEPEVARHINIPVPTKVVHEVAWDDAHLGYYLTIADEFARWWRTTHQDSKANNLALLLARIGAVERACDVPQMRPKTGPIWRHGLTSRQRAVLARAQVLVGEGRKLVVFAKNPEQLELMAGHLRAQSIESVVFHGGIDRTARNQELDQRFRYGPAPVLLASFGVMRAGWDLYQATHALYADRLWSASREDQAATRLLRPQQQHGVNLEFFHLQGSISCYQAQMVEFKGNAADAGLDWGAPIDDDVPYLHLDTIIERFVDALATRQGLKRSAFRDAIKEAA